MFAEDFIDLNIIKNEILMKEINPWDKIILVYLGYLGYLNMQTAYYSYKSIVSHDEMTLMQQFYHCFLLMYCMVNVNQSYKYFLLKTYTISPLIAKKIYAKFNKYFDFFAENADNIGNYMAMSNKMKDVATNMNDYDIKFNVEIKPKKRYDDSSSEEDNNENEDGNENNNDNENGGSINFSHTTNLDELNNFRKYYNINDNLEKMLDDIEKNKVIFEKFRKANKKEDNNENNSTENNEKED